MKQIKQRLIKSAMTLVGLTLLSWNGYAKEHVTMTLKNISSTSNTIEYDLYIVNDGTTKLKLSACSFGVNYNADIENGGTLSYKFIENTRGERLNGLTSFSMNMVKKDDINQLRMTTVPLRFENAFELPLHEAHKVGRFRVTNSTSWAANSKPSFALQELLKIGVTTTQIVAYIDDNKQMIPLTPAKQTVATVVEGDIVLNPVTNTSKAVMPPSVAKSDLDLTEASAKSMDVNIYPIPAVDLLYIDIYSKTNQTIRITINDVKGSLVREIRSDLVEGLNKVNVDVTQFNTGVYLLQVTTEDGVLHQQSISKK